MADVAPTPPGWYDHENGLRYWNGDEWTEHRAPKPPPSPRTITWPEVFVAVALGMLVGWALIWAGAQAAPDTFYWPIKVVVEEGSFNGLR